MVGGVVGGIAFFAFIIFAALLWQRRKRRQLAQRLEYELNTDGNYPSLVAPYSYQPQGQDQEQRLRASRSSHTLQETYSQPGIIPSSKARLEALLAAGGVSSNASSGCNDEEHGSSETGSVHAGRVGVPPEYLGLRVEVDDLRRVVQEMQTERLDAPPEYQVVQERGADAQQTASQEQTQD